jgi:hypothetical protein
MSLGLVFDDRPLGSLLLKIKNKGFPENRMYSELRLWLDQPNGGPEDPELATHYYHDRARLEAVIAHSRRIGGPVLIRSLPKSDGTSIQKLPVFTSVALKRDLGAVDHGCGDYITM